MSSIDALKNAVRDVPDFPIPGILFKDITPVLADPVLFRTAVDLFVRRHEKSGLKRIACIDARGFLLGSAAAYALKCGVIPIRKKGKLPYKTLCQSYALEYGTAELSMHVDAVEPGEKILIIDDLLATGGTLRAACQLLEQAGAKVIEADVLIELEFLKGREKIAPVPLYAAFSY